MSSKIFSAVCVILFIAAFSSCRGSKKATRKKNVADSTITVKKDTVIMSNPINNEKGILIAALKPLWAKEIHYADFSGKAKCHYEGKGNKQDFTANIRMKEGKEIWVSVTALGGIVQVARILITPDSFKLVNYLENSYMLMPLSEAKKVLPVPMDFTILQNLIVGNVLKKEGQFTDATDFGGSLSLQVDGADFIQQATYNKIDSTLRSLQMRSVGNNNTTGMIQYGNYEKRSNQTISMSRAININNNGEQYFLEMNFTNIDLDRVVDMPFSIPSKYERK